MTEIEKKVEGLKARLDAMEEILKVLLRQIGGSCTELKSHHKIVEGPGSIQSILNIR